MNFLMKIVRFNGNEEGHVFHEYQWNEEEKMIQISRDDMDPYVITLDQMDVAYAQEGRNTFSVFNRHVRDLKNDPWSKK